MGIRPYCFCLSLLAALGSGAMPATADPLPVPGMGLGLSARSASVVPIDMEGLAQTLCAEMGDPGPSSGVHYVKCTVTVKNADPTNGTKLDPMWTPCGVWDPLLVVDLAHLPFFTAGTQEAAPDSGQERFAGVLAMNTKLRFKNRETGRTVELALHLGAGPADSSAATVSDVSRAGSLISFGDGEEEGSKIWEFQDCIPGGFVKLYPSYENVGEVCPICPSSDFTGENGEGGDPGH